MKMTVRIEGTAEIARKMRAMGQVLTRETLIPIMIDELQPMADQMRTTAARGSGQLADSVTVGTELSPAQTAINEPIADVEVYVGPGPLPQAIQEEFGNYRQTPRPFIAPSFDAQVDRALDRVGTRGIAAILATAKKG